MLIKLKLLNEYECIIITYYVNCGTIQPRSGKHHDSQHEMRLRVTVSFTAGCVGASVSRWPSVRYFTLTSPLCCVTQDIGESFQDSH